LLNDFDLNKKIIEKIEDAGNLSIQILNKSIGSFSKKDINEANENIGSVKNLEKKCLDISTLALKQDQEITISIGYIVESIRRIGEYAGDISETVINQLITEEK
jgi:phosphate uptake regulator